jgi:hypothetical protein
MVAPKRNYVPLNQLFIKLNFIFLNNIKFVEGIKSMFSFKIFILLPLCSAVWGGSTVSPPPPRATPLHTLNRTAAVLGDFALHTVPYR